MKKSTILLSTLSVFAVLLSSCVQKEAPIVEVPTYQMEFTAGLAQDQETKVNINGTNTVYWNSNDKISVLDGVNNNEFTIDNTKETIEGVDYGPGYANAKFTGTAAQASTYYAVYPYNAANSVTAGVITTTIPSVQEVQRSTFGKDMNVLYSVSQGNALSFNAATTVLKFTIVSVPSGRTIKSVKIESQKEGGQALSGTTTIDTADGTITASATSVTLVNKEGSTSDVTTLLAGQTYFACLAPVAIEGGLQFTFTYDDDSYGVIAANGNVTCAAGQIFDLGNVESPVLINKNETITVIAPASNSETKASLGAGTTSGDVTTFPVQWLHKDTIKVFSSAVPAGAQYIANLSGVNSKQAAEATFEAAPTGVAKDVKRYAIYPACEAQELASDGSLVLNLSQLSSQLYHSTLANYALFSKYKIAATPNDFSAARRNYWNTTVYPWLPLYGVAEAGSDEFHFNNIFGAVYVRVEDYMGLDISAKKATLTTEKYITGTMTLNPETGEYTLTGTSDVEKTMEVRSSGASGILLANSSALKSLGSTGVAFYFFVPAGTYEKFDIAFELTDGRIVTLRLQNVTVTAGQAALYNPDPDNSKLSHFPLSMYYGAENCYETRVGDDVTIDVTPYYTFDKLLRRGTAEENKVQGTLPTVTPNVEWWTVIGTKTLNPTGSYVQIPTAPTITDNVMTLKMEGGRGNALVSLKDENGKILWSYHIWCDKKATETAGIETYTYTIGSDSFEMMQKTLGAINVSVTSASNAHFTYGLFYQWGRKDPLPTVGYYDSSLTNKYPNCAYFTVKTFANTTGNTINYALQNPQEMVQCSASNRSFLPSGTVHAANALLWGNNNRNAGYVYTKQATVKTIYDPCPEGYMIPQPYHFSGLTIAKDPSDSSKDWTRQGYGAYMVYNGTDSCYYPLPGFVAANATVTYGEDIPTKYPTGQASYYQTSATYGTGGWASNMYGVNSTAGGTLSKKYQYSSQANAESVRCLKIAE